MSVKSGIHVCEHGNEIRWSLQVVPQSGKWSKGPYLRITYQAGCAWCMPLSRTVIRQSAAAA